jgi:hypothetical protein
MFSSFDFVYEIFLNGGGRLKFREWLTIYPNLCALFSSMILWRIKALGIHPIKQRLINIQFGTLYPKICGNNSDGNASWGSTSSLLFSSLLFSSLPFPSLLSLSFGQLVWFFSLINRFLLFFFANSLANFYFLLVAIIQSSPISPLTPITAIFPLVFVITLTGMHTHTIWLSLSSKRNKFYSEEIDLISNSLFFSD